MKDDVGETPINVYDPAGGGARPTVGIAHGFADSQQLKQSFAYTLAHDGYRAVAFDFLGHGRHPRPLTGDVTRVEGATVRLLAQLAAVVDHTLSLPQASGKLALVGHSMASDIVVRHAQSDPRVDATVAVSMFSPSVTISTPANLLVIAGGLEGFLEREALRVAGMVAQFPEAERTYGSVGQGTAPRFAHLVKRTAFLGSLGIAVALSFEALSFLLIIAGMILLYFLVHGLFGAWIYRATGHPAMGTLANAAAFAWALTVVFPMLAG